VAAVYGLIVQSHHVFGIFYSLTLVGLGRGGWLAYCATRQRHQSANTAPLQSARLPLP
jgi:hypothetical protein